MQINQVQKAIRHWKKYTAASTNWKIFSATVTIIVCTVIIKVVAFFKESIVAWKFGSSRVLDAFIIAAIIPDFVVNIIASPLNSALLPTYMKVREKEDSDASAKLLSGVFYCSLFLLGITTLIIFLAIPVYLPWMTTGFDVDQFKLTIHLLYIVIPIILLSGTIALCSGILNALECFKAAAFSPVFTPAVTIVLLILWGDSLGVFALAFGLSSGAALELLFLGILLYRRGLLIRPKFPGLTPALRKVINRYPPSIMAALLMCSSGLIDQSMAAMLTPGSVATLNYASRVNSIPLTLVSTGLSAAAFTYFSKMIAESNWQGVCYSLKSYLKFIFAATIPCSLILIFLSEPIVRLLFERGEFTAVETHNVAQVLAAFSLQIPFYVACVLVTRLLISLNLQHVLMWGSALCLIINISLNYIFLNWFGVVGIALSTSFVYLFSFFYVLSFANKHLNRYSRV
jgi:putative peptidoglycan lipid II flippase